DPYTFARWRCWKEYGTGLAGDLLVHLVSGMMFMMSINDAPRQALSAGGIRRWKDGRNMPDVHATLFYYGDLPVYMRLNQGTEVPETYRFQGSKGILEVNEFGLSFTPQSGKDTAPSYYANSFPHAMHAEYEKKWHAENDPKIGQEPMVEAVRLRHFCALIEAHVNRQVAVIEESGVHVGHVTAIFPATDSACRERLPRGLIDAHHEHHAADQVN